MDTEVSVFNGLQAQHLALDELPVQITEFISSAKAAQQSLVLRQKLLEDKLASSELFVDSEINKIQGVVAHFQNILKDAGAQEWRTAAEAVHKEGRQHVQTFQSNLGDVKKIVKDSCTHLDNASSQLVKGLSKTLGNLRTTELEQLAEDTAQEVKLLASAATKQMAELGRWFYWKNLMFVMFLSLVVVLITGLFIDDEWPWESHKTAVKERVAGQALLEVWPTLSLNDQQRILSNVA